MTTGMFTAASSWAASVVATPPPSGARPDAPGLIDGLQLVAAAVMAVLLALGLDAPGPRSAGPM